MAILTSFKDYFLPGILTEYNELLIAEVYRNLMSIKSSPSRKPLPFKLKSLDEAGTGKFEGYLSVFGNVDSYRDVVDRGSFKKTILDAKSKKEDVLFPILWQHNPYEPIGGFTDMSEDDHGLYVKGQLDLSLPRGQHAYSGMKQGYLKGLSIGYETVKEDWTKDIRHLKEIKLYEGSVVTFPANDDAQVVSVKQREFKDGPGLDALVNVVQCLDNEADYFDSCADHLMSILGIPDPDEGTLGSTPSPAVAAIDSAAGLSPIAQQLDALSDQLIDLADNLMAALGIPDDDYLYGYMADSRTFERKVGKVLSAANRQRMHKAVDTIGQGHADLTSLLQETEPDSENEQSSESTTHETKQDPEPVVEPTQEELEALREIAEFSAKVREDMKRLKDGRD